MLKNTAIMNIIVYFFLAILVFSCGCLLDPLNTLSSTGAGIKLESFEFSPTSIDDNMKTTASLVLKNTGTYDAEYVDIIFFGLNDEEWDVVDSTGIEEGVSLDSPLSFTRIRAQNKEESIPMQKKKITLILENTEDLERDIIYEYNIIARICYNYHTTSTIKVETITENEFLILNEEKKFRQYPITADTTEGPVYIEVTSKQPQVVSTDDEIHLKLKITNIGGGTPTLEDTCSSVLNPSGDLENIIQNLNKVFFESDKCYIESGADNEEIYLKKGKSKEIDVVCDADATSKKEHMIKITAYYDYYYDSNKIKVKVRGTMAAGGMYSGGIAHLSDKEGTKLIEKMKPSDAFHLPYITVQINQDEDDDDESFPFESAETISSEEISGLTTDIVVKAVVIPGSYVDENVLLEDVENLYISDSGLLSDFTLDDLDRIDQNSDSPNVISKQYYYYNRDAKRARDVARRKVEREGGNIADYMPDDDEYSPYPEDELGIVDAVSGCHSGAGSLKLSEMEEINGLDIESSTREDTTAFEWQKIGTKITSIKVRHCGERTVDELTDGKLTFIDLSQIYMNQLTDVSFIGADEDYVNFVVDGIDDNEKKIMGYVTQITEINPNSVAKAKKTATGTCKTCCSAYSNSACFSPKESSLDTANTGVYRYICYYNRLYMATEHSGTSIWNECDDGYKCVCYDTIHSMDDEIVLFCPQYE